MHEHFKFHHVEADKLTLAWDAILPGLQRIKSRGRCATWRVEDVYLALREKRADAFLVYLDGNYAGFVILAVTQEPFTLQERLLVWAVSVAATKGVKRLMFREQKEAFSLTLEEIYRIARERNIKIVRMHTGRKGWMRRLLSLGWSIFEYVFEYEIKEVA